jgi:hypothetical protein
MAELLGEPFIVEVFHRKSKDGKKVYANLKGPDGYNVKGTTVQDRLTGKPVVIDVARTVTELKYSIWAAADEEVWGSICMPGEWEEVKDAEGNVIRVALSKKVIQNRIKQAKNWHQHPLYEKVNKPTME